VPWGACSGAESRLVIRTAVILAAGLGSRLGAEGPKGALRLGERSIVEESLTRLERAGMAHVVIVTGHAREFYERLPETRRGLVRTVHNPHYAESGSMASLFCARDAVDSDFLLLESDLIYERRALDVLLETPERDVVLLSGATGAGDEVWVETEGALLRRMSKDRGALGPQVAGELVGITKVSTALFQVMLELAGVAFRDTLRVDYETDTLVQAARVHPVRCLRVDDLLWAEIDDAAHLARAREQVYPAIVAKENR